MRETECGVAALAIVLAHHGAWVPFRDLRTLCHVTDQGVTALSLVQAGKHYGLGIRGMRLGVEALRLVQSPVILSWEQWHFVVLEGIRDEVAWINDPARGHRRISIDDLRRSYSGVALISHPGPDFKQMGERRQPLKAMMELLRPGWKPLTLFTAASVTEAVLLPVTVSAFGDVMTAGPRSRAGSWRSLAITLGSLAGASAARHWLSARTEKAIAKDSDMRGAWAVEPRHPTMYPAETTVQIVTAATRMSVSIPLLLLILARVHPASALIIMPALAAPLLTRSPHRGRASPPFRSNGYDPPGGWKYRMIAEATPALLARVLSRGATVPTVIVAFGASWVAFRLVDSANDAIGMLYQLPESIDNLSTTPERSRLVNQFA